MPQIFGFYFSCGQIAKERSYKYFCIEFFGECWGYNYLDLSTPKETHGKCWGKRPIYNQCNHNLTKPICVGVASHGYVYELQVITVIIHFSKPCLNGSQQLFNIMTGSLHTSVEYNHQDAFRNHVCNVNRSSCLSTLLRNSMFAQK